MTDSTNPRVMADNIRELYDKQLAQAAELVALGTYSTDEFDTGKKYGGKTVYGIIAEGTYPTTDNGVYTDKNIIKVEDVDEVLKLSGIITVGASIVAAPHVNNSGFFAKVLYAKTLEYIYISTNGASFSECPVKIYMEYTKAATPTPDVLPSPDPDTRALEELETEPEESEPIEEKK